MPEQQTIVYGLIVHPDQRHILLLQTEDGWTLPQYETDNEAEINRATLTRFGLSTTVLDRIYKTSDNQERADPEAPLPEEIYALECHSPDVRLSIPASWIARSELASLPLKDPEHPAILQQWLSQDRSNQRLPPWYKSGWYASAAGWAEEQLAHHQYQQTGPIEQVAVRSWGTVLRIPTTSHVLYFKAAAPIFHFEPLLAQTLAQLVPTMVPPVVSIDQPRHWLLMEDGGVPLRDQPRDPALLEVAWVQHAHMQLDLIPHFDTLLATGCPDQRLHHLPELYSELLADIPFLRIGTGGLLPSEYEQLQALKPRFAEMCAELASYQIPSSLVHEDLHSKNVVVNEQGQYVFIDAGEYSLSHPFFSLYVALRDQRYILKYDDQVRERLIQAYLEPWTRFEPMERLQQAFALAYHLGAFYRALFWYRFLRTQDNWRQINDDAVPYFLCEFLGTADRWD
jgi:hypothetical protein